MREENMWLITYEHTIFVQGREDIGNSGYTVIGIYDNVSFTEQAIKRALEFVDMKWEDRIRLGQKDEYDFINNEIYHDEVNDVDCQEIKNVKVRKMVVNEDY